MAGPGSAARCEFWKMYIANERQQPIDRMRGPTPEDRQRTRAAIDDKQARHSAPGSIARQALRYRLAACGLLREAKRPVLWTLSAGGACSWCG